LPSAGDSCHNPSYLGGRDQEDQGSKPARANSLRDPILKIPNTKRERVGRMIQVVESLHSKGGALSSNHSTSPHPTKKEHLSRDNLK
jgi:hypothetical protein